MLLNLEPAMKFLSLTRSVLAVALLFLAVTALCSCAAMKSDPVTSQAVARMVTSQTIERADDPQHLAARIAIIGEQTLLVLQPDARTTLDIVVALVQAKIDYESLSPADRDAVDFLLLALQAELRDRISAGELQPDEILLVRDLVEWVVDSAKRYLPQG